MGRWGCSQYVPVMDVTKRPAHVTSQGGVSAEVGMRASTLWAKHGIEAPGPISGEKRYGYPLRSLWCVALSWEDNGDSFRPDEVPRRLCSWSRASAIYKATPKGRVMR